MVSVSLLQFVGSHADILSCQYKFVAKQYKDAVCFYSNSEINWVLLRQCSDKLKVGKLSTNGK